MTKKIVWITVLIVTAGILQSTLLSPLSMYFYAKPDLALDPKRRRVEVVGRNRVGKQQVEQKQKTCLHQRSACTAGAGASHTARCHGPDAEEGLGAGG